MKVDHKRVSTDFEFGRATTVRASNRKYINFKLLQTYGLHHRCRCKDVSWALVRRFIMKTTVNLIFEWHEAFKIRLQAVHERREEPVITYNQCRLPRYILKYGMETFSSYRAMVNIVLLSNDRNYKRKELCRGPQQQSSRKESQQQWFQKRKRSLAASLCRIAHHSTPGSPPSSVPRLFETESIFIHVRVIFQTDIGTYIYMEVAGKISAKRSRSSATAFSCPTKHNPPPAWSPPPPPPLWYGTQYHE